MLQHRRRLEHRRVDCKNACSSSEGYWSIVELGCKNACSCLEKGWSIAEVAVMVVGLGGGDRDGYLVLSTVTTTDGPSFDKERSTLGKNHFELKHLGC